MATLKTAILFFIMSGLLFFIIGCSGDNEITGNNPSIKNFQTIATGSTYTGDVLIELTPRLIENDKLAVDFAANTHSVDLSQFDIMKRTSLEYGGKSIKPVSAPKLSGHHSSGTLVFDAGKELKSLKIIIKGIPAVEERVFEWN